MLDPAPPVIDTTTLVAGAAVIAALIALGGVFLANKANFLNLVPGSLVIRGRQCLVIRRALLVNHSKGTTKVIHPNRYTSILTTSWQPYGSQESFRDK